MSTLTIQDAGPDTNDYIAGSSDGRNLKLFPKSTLGTGGGAPSVGTGLQKGDGAGGFAAAGIGDVPPGYPYANLAGAPAAIARGGHTVATSSLAPNAVDSSKNIDLGGHTAVLLQIQTDFAAWVVIYATASARTADASRSSTTDPTPGSGVLAEFITTASALIINCSPTPLLASEESSPQTFLPIRVTNLSGTTQVTNVTIATLPIQP